MKVTNLETSQNLKELGFEAETDYNYFLCNNGYQLFHHSERTIAWDKGIPAYDLETILEALPKVLQGYELCIYFGASFEATKITYNWQKLEVKQNWKESLANTAGRLLVKLLEDNIIKLGE